MQVEITFRPALSSKYERDGCRENTNVVWVGNAV
ncbi:MAG: hypothetical protein OD814_001357 [Candidatus Alkanophagales archaeon MCA70_species_1]|nr:hypothetical protein [Candidatus Alkanophaga volatiphilum]